MTGAEAILLGWVFAQAGGAAGAAAAAEPGAPRSEAGGGRGRVLSLSEARTLALGGEAAEAARARIRAAAARVELARSRRRPQLEVRADVSASPGGELLEIQADDLDPDAEPGSVFISGTRDIDQARAAIPLVRYRSELALDWNLFDFGKTGAAIDAAEAVRGAQKASARADQAERLHTVDAAYVAWVAAWEQTRLERQGLDRLEARLESLEGRVRVGLLPESALGASRAEVAAARLRLAESEQLRDQARLRLERELRTRLPAFEPDRSVLEWGKAASASSAGRSQIVANEDTEENQEDGTKSAAGTEPGPPNVTGAPIDSIDARVRAVRARAESARADARANRSRPRLGAEAVVGVRGQDITALFPLYRVGLGIAWPLWDGGASKARAEARVADARALDAERRRLEAERAQVRRQHDLSLRHARRRARLAAEWVRVTAEHLNDVEARYAEASATADELARARSAHRQARGQLLRARVDRTEAFLGL
ncbi:MAG TPA: TolC family protein [Myxococcales bacterium LLY-WYZ-16_1]|nr:TolC family protein [Myxococcales bacterium LLY-WYZ-16_1]